MMLPIMLKPFAGKVLVPGLFCDPPKFVGIVAQATTVLLRISTCCRRRSRAQHGADEKIVDDVLSIISSDMIPWPPLRKTLPSITGPLALTPKLKVVGMAPAIVVMGKITDDAGILAWFAMSMPSM